MLIEGPAGIGKTAVLAAAQSEARANGFRVLRAGGLELEREFAFGVVRQLFEPVTASSSADELEELLGGPPETAVRLLGLPGLPEASGAVPGPVQDPSFAILHGLYWLCVNLSAQRPLALVVDDLQWSDSASLRFLAFLLPRINELRILLLFGARASEAGTNQPLVESLVVTWSTEVVTVDPLSPTGVAKVAEAVCGTAPETDFVKACFEVTSGNPFLVWRVLEALRAEEIEPLAASVPEVERVGTKSLGRWASQRIGQLGPNAARVARALSVLESAEPAQVAQLAGLGSNESAEALDLLARADILEVRPLRFRHPLLRAATYEEIGLAERSELHRQAAAVLASSNAGPARVAEHLLLAEPVADLWVVVQLKTAAGEALARGSPESAVSYLKRALDECPAQADDAELLLPLALAEFSAGQGGWQDHLEESVEKAQDPTSEMTAAVAAAIAIAGTQQYARAIEICDRVAARLEAQDEGRLLLESLAVIFDMSTASVTTRGYEHIRRLIEQAEDPSTPPATLAIAANAAASSNWPADHVATLGRRAVSLDPNETPDPWVSAFWVLSGIGALYLCELYDEAQRLADAAVTEARARANALGLDHVLAQRALLALRRSDLTAAEGDARALLDMHGVIPSEISRQMATKVLVSVLAERGEFELAELAIDNLGKDVESNCLTAALVRHARGRLRFAQHRYADALEDFQQVGTIATACQTTSPCVMPWRSDSALTSLALGDTRTAHRLADEEVELARSFGAPRYIGTALRAAGLVAGGHDGEQLLRESVRLLDGREARLEWSYALTDLGALLRRTNRRGEASTLLRQALDAAHHLGAKVLAQRAEIELRSTGAKPRRVQLTGLEALTASERRVAELACQGLTNREVAQTLFVTPRTVEGHLTKVFQKLNITTRVDLPRALESPAPVGTR
jgi:DNA-binding CsgD family transcriptional regulator